MVNCRKCERPAMYRIFTKTKGFGDSKIGGAAHIVYGCDEHKEVLKVEVEETIADGERACGNPFYPKISITGFGPAQIAPFRNC